VRISRIYVRPDQLAEAQAALSKLTGGAG
jgi:hypothetical protein